MLGGVCAGGEKLALLCALADVVVAGVGGPGSLASLPAGADSGKLRPAAAAKPPLFEILLGAERRGPVREMAM